MAAVAVTNIAQPVANEYGEGSIQHLCAEYMILKHYDSKLADQVMEDLMEKMRSDGVDPANLGPYQAQVAAVLFTPSQLKDIELGKTTGKLLIAGISNADKADVAAAAEKRREIKTIVAAPPPPAPTPTPASGSLSDISPELQALIKVAEDLASKGIPAVDKRHWLIKDPAWTDVPMGVCAKLNAAHDSTGSNDLVGWLAKAGQSGGPSFAQLESFEARASQPVAPVVTGAPGGVTGTSAAAPPAPPQPDPADFDGRRIKGNETVDFNKGGGLFKKPNRKVTSWLVEQNSHGKAFEPVMDINIFEFDGPVTEVVRAVNENGTYTLTAVEGSRFISSLKVSNGRTTNYTRNEQGGRNQHVNGTEIARGWGQALIDVLTRRKTIDAAAEHAGRTTVDESAGAVGEFFKQDDWRKFTTQVNEKSFDGTLFKYGGGPIRIISEEEFYAKYPKGYTNVDVPSKLDHMLRKSGTVPSNLIGGDLLNQAQYAGVQVQPDLDGGNPEVKPKEKFTDKIMRQMREKNRAKTQGRDAVVSAEDQVRAILDGGGVGKSGNHAAEHDPATRKDSPTERTV
ncbi:MAG: hypothetical protein P8P30_00045 [Rickettsiales bacterium]|nr:hypothetical protein [Rickettsiales bacterium]